MAVTETGHAAAREIDDLYRRHGGEVYRYALAVLGNHADAEDVTQTTFLNAYRSLEQGVRPRKPSNWLLTIASNAIKQRFRQEQARPRQVELDDRIADRSPEATGPTVGEILTALSRIAPQQRQAIVLREFEGRSYKEIAEILNVTVSALETLLFRARRVARRGARAPAHVHGGAVRRLAGRGWTPRAQGAPPASRPSRRVSRLRTVRAGPETASAGTSRARAGSDSRLSHALPGLRGLGDGSDAAGGRCGNGSCGRVWWRERFVVGGGALAGGVALKAAAVVTAAGVAGGVGVVGATEIESKVKTKPPAKVEKPGKRLGQTAPRGVLVPGRGVARGKASAPGQTKLGKPRSSRSGNSSSSGSRGKSADAKAQAPGQSGRDAKPTKNAKAEKRNSERVTRQPNRVRPNLEAEKSRGKAVGPRKSPPSRSGKR